MHQKRTYNEYMSKNILVQLPFAEPDPERLRTEAQARLHDALVHADALAQVARQALAAEQEPPGGGRLSGADIDRRCGHTVRLIGAVARLQAAEVAGVRAIARLKGDPRNAKNRRI
jgi:hypothetical protein